MWKARQLDCWFWPMDRCVVSSATNIWLRQHRQWDMMDDNMDVNAKWLVKFWRSQLRAGPRDAVFALILALVPGPEMLTLSGLDDCENWIKNDDTTRNRPTGNLIRILVRGVKNGQTDALQQPNVSSPILPRLRSIALQQPEKIFHKKLDNANYGCGGRLNMWHVMPILYSPLLESAEIWGCADTFLHQ